MNLYDIVKITTQKLADLAVTTVKIVDSAITTAKLADSSVTTAKLADGSVTGAKIAAGTIVNADVSSSANIDGTKISPNFGNQLIETLGQLSIGASAEINGQFRAAQGTTGTPGISFVGDGNTGFYRPALNSIGFVNGASESLRITSNGSVGIGTSSVNSAAILQLNSATQGFLPPRMTTTQRDAIATPPEGLVIYNTTTNVLNFYNGSAWGAV